MSKGQLYILSGPSGSGKDTVLSKLLFDHANVKLSISSVTRDMRVGEVEGKKYNFISGEEFQNLIDNDMLLEYNEYCGNYYGTPNEPVFAAISAGEDIILEIDVNGADVVRQKVPESISIFIMPPSFEVLKCRLCGRGTDSKKVIDDRLAQAVYEMRQAYKYDFIVINDDLNKAVIDLWSIINSQHSKINRNKNFIDEVLEKC